MDPEPTSILTLLQTDWLIDFILFIVLILLLLGSALFAGSEVAYFSLTKRDIETAEENNVVGVDKLQDTLEHPKRLLAIVLIVLNFINIGIVIVISKLRDELFHIPAFNIGSIHITEVTAEFLAEFALDAFLILLFGEILPKVFASKKPLQFALFADPIIRFSGSFFSPLSKLLLNISSFIEKKLGDKKETFSVDQLSQALELTSDNVDKEDEEDHKILEGIVTFGNTDTKQVMTPRVDMFALRFDLSFNDVLKKISEFGYSRIPVYKESIDDIEGVLYVKDLILHINEDEYNWRELLRKPFFVPENKKLDDLLDDFKERKVHLAVVVDEYGGTSGIVSLDDIIEEIVGDISDEFDDDDVFYTKIDSSNYTFEGKTSLKDFYRIMDIEDEEVFEGVKGEADTLGGFIIELIEQYPKQRQKINFDKFTFTIEALDRKRIKQIKVTRNESQNDEVEK